MLQLSNEVVNVNNPENILLLYFTSAELKLVLTDSHENLNRLEDKEEE